MHLTDATYTALLDGTLPPKEARALAHHLAGDCEICERFLAEQPDAGPLDGRADAAIAAGLPPRDGQGNDLEFARIRRALGAEAAMPRRRLIPGAIAASLLIAGVAGLVALQLRDRPSGGAEWDGAKGMDARPIPVRLRFLRLAPGGAVEKGLSGEPADRSSSLLFEVETGRAAEVALARVGPGGAVEVIWRSRLSAGRTQVTVDGKTAAYPLAALTGPQRFVLLAGAASLEEARAIRAAAALAPPAGIRTDSAAFDGLSVDVVEILVR